MNKIPLTQEIFDSMIELDIQSLSIDSLFEDDDLYLFTDEQVVKYIEDKIIHLDKIHTIQFHPSKKIDVSFLAKKESLQNIIIPKTHIKSPFFILDMTNLKFIGSLDEFLFSGFTSNVGFSSFTFTVIPPVGKLNDISTLKTKLKYVKNIVDFFYNDK